MGRKIYNRFEILKESAGSPANIVYKSQDRDGSIVQLLEWTPEPGVLAVSKAKLNDARDAVPDVEVFSSGASLYIASPLASDALSAVRKLQTWDLFLGPWPGLTQEIPGPNPVPPALDDPKQEAIADDTTVLLTPPIVIPPIVIPPIVTPPPPPPPPKPTVDRPSRWLKPVIAGFVLILLAGAAGVAWKERNRRIAEDQRQQQLQQARLADLERQRREEQLKLDEAKAVTEKQQTELQRMRQEALQHQIDLANERRQKDTAEESLRQERRRAEAAKAERLRKDREERARQEREKERMRVAEKERERLRQAQEQERIELAKGKVISDNFAQRQAALAAGLSNQYHQIRLINKCDSAAIDVAIRFESLDHAWVTQGWWRVDPHQEKAANLVYSQNGTFYFYAEGGDNVWNGQDANAVGMEVVENGFTHLTGPIFGKNKRVVKAIRRDFLSGYGEHPVPFDCHN